MALDLNQLRQEYPVMKDASDDDIIEFVYQDTGAHKRGSIDDFRDFIGHPKVKGERQGDSRSLLQRSVGPLLEPAKGMGAAAADLVGAVPGMLGFIYKSAEALTSPLTGKPIAESKKDAEEFAHRSTPTVIAGINDEMQTNPAYRDLFGTPMALIDKAVKKTSKTVSDAVGGDDPLAAGTEMALMSGMASLGFKGSVKGAQAKGARKGNAIMERGQTDILGGEMDHNAALNAIWKGDMKQAAADAVKKAENEVYSGPAEPPGTAPRQQATPPQPTVQPAPGEVPLAPEGSVLRAFQDAQRRTQEGLDLNARRQDQVQGLTPQEAMMAQFQDLTSQSRRTTGARAEGLAEIAAREAERVQQEATMEQARQAMQDVGGKANSDMAVQSFMDRVGKADAFEFPRGDEGVSSVMDRRAGILERGQEAARTRETEARLLEEQRAREQEAKVRQEAEMWNQQRNAAGEKEMFLGEMSDRIQRAAEAARELPKEPTGLGELLQERQQANARHAEIMDRLDAIEKEKRGLQTTRDGLERTNPEMSRESKQLSRRIRELNTEAGTLRNEARDIRRRPISSSGKMGRQRGAINPFGKGKESPKLESPEARERAEFEANLPESMKHMADQLWARFKGASGEAKQQEPLTQAQTRVEGPQIEAVKKVPGLQSVIDRFNPDIIPVEDIIKKMSLEKDIGFESPKGNKASNAVKWFWEAGGQLAAQFSHSSGVKWGAAHVMDAVRNAEKMKIEFSKPVIKAWDSLKKEEFSSIFRTMIENEGTRFNAEQLKGKGFSDKAIRAYENFQNLTDSVLKTINDRRAAMGKEPIQGIMGYFPHLFYGDYRAFITQKTETGVKTLWAISGKTPQEIAHIRNHIIEKTGLKDVDVTPAQKVSLTEYGKKTADTVVGMSEILRMLEDGSPEAIEIKGVMDKYLTQRGYKSRGVKQHMEHRSTVEVPLGDGLTAEGAQGYAGRRIWLDDAKNAHEGINAAVRYLERVFEWDQMQQAEKAIGKVLGDPKLQETHPNTLAAMRQYLDNYTGARNMRNDVLGKILHDPMVMNIGAEAANVMRGVMLGWNGAFFVSQIMQVFTMMPSYLAMLSKEGNAPIINGVGRSVADMGWAFGGDAKTIIGKEAAKAAEAYGFTEPHFRDEIRPAFANKVNKAYHGAMNITLELPDKFTRRAAYMTYYHVLHDMGMRGDKLAKTAANMTDTSMVNYRPQERAQAYQDLGALGTAMGTLKTFVTNQMHNNVGIARTQGVFSVPYLTLITSQLALGGLLGFYAMDELKKVWGVAQTLHDKMTNKRLPSIEEIILSSKIPDWLAYGLPSAAAGVDISSKFSAANMLPDGASDFAPYLGSLFDTGSAAAELAANPNKANFANVLRKSPMAILKAAGEDMMTKEGILLELQGGRLVGGPNRRDDEDGRDRIARYAGTRTLKESKERAISRFNEETRKWSKKGMEEARSKQSKENLDGVQLDTKELMRYLGHGGTVEAYTNQIIQGEINKRLTNDQRFLLESGKNPAIMLNRPEVNR